MLGRNTGVVLRLLGSRCRCCSDSQQAQSQLLLGSGKATSMALQVPVSGSGVILLVQVQDKVGLCRTPGLVRVDGPSLPQPSLLFGTDPLVRPVSIRS